jgi:hypothetical protein
MSRFKSVDPPAVGKSVKDCASVVDSLAVGVRAAAEGD